MKFIDLFNQNISDAIDKSDEVYTSLIGDKEFTPIIPVVNSEDVNCGALCNELEYAKLQTWKLIDAMGIDSGEGGELEDIITAIVDLPRRGVVESDSIYRNRFRFLVTAQSNMRRITKWAIISALSHFIPNMSAVQFIEPFSINNLYFQIRVRGEGGDNYEGILFLDDAVDGYLDQSFLGGYGIGAIVTYLSEMVQRIKCAGVDFDVLFINQDRFTKTSTASIGTIRRTYLSSARIKHIRTITKSSNAEVVVAP